MNEMVNLTPEELAKLHQAGEGQNAPEETKVFIVEDHPDHTIVTNPA